MPSKWIGASTKDKLARDGVRGRRTICSITRTSLVTPVNENVVCSRIQDSLWDQLKKTGPSSVQRMSVPRMST